MKTAHCLKQIAVLQIAGLILSTASPAMALRPDQDAVGAKVASALNPNTGLEENLSKLLEEAQSESPESRIKSAQKLGHFFDGIGTTMNRRTVIPFSEVPGRRHVPAYRRLPDLSPITALGAIAVFKGGVIGGGDKNAIDLASASNMRPAIERLYRIAGWNWQNRSGEGKRDGIGDTDHIPPMDTPAILGPGWPIIYTANDPVDATTRTAQGLDGGTVLFTETPDFGDMFPDELRTEYVVYAGRQAAFDLNDPYSVKFQRIASANHHSVNEYEVWVLNRPHHKEIIQAAQKLGARVRLYQDGTVQPAIYLAAHPEKPIILAGRVGATEGKMVAAPLRNIEYLDGGKVWMRARMISENSGYEVEQKTAPDGTVYYVPRTVNGKKVASNNLENGTKLNLQDIRALRDAGYSDDQIQDIRDGILEYSLDDLAPAAGDFFLSFIMDPMTDIDGEPLYDWGEDVRGVRVENGILIANTLELAADGVHIVEYRYPDGSLGTIAAQLQEHEAVVARLRHMAIHDAAEDVRVAARQALRDYLPHAWNLDFQRLAALGAAGLAGLEEGRQAAVAVSDAVKTGVKAQYGSASYALGVRTGGTNLSVGLVNVAGEVETRTSPEEINWRRLLFGHLGDDETINAHVERLVREGGPAAQEVAERIVRILAEHIIATLRASELPLEQFHHITVSFPGPVNTETGHAGTPFPAPSIPGFDDYAMAERLQALIRAELGITVRVEVINDADAALKGEVAPTGTAPGIRNVAIAIWGSGMNSAGQKDGQPFNADGAYQETGHAVVGGLGEDGLWHYENRGLQLLGTRPVLAEGEMEVEQRLAGPALLKRFREAGYQDGKDVAYKARLDNPNIAERDAARALIVDIGAEAGRAYAAQQAPFMLAPYNWIPERFVLVSGVAEDFAKDVVDEEGRDLLLTAIRQAALAELNSGRFGQLPDGAAETFSSGIVRSIRRAEREMAAAAQGFRQAGLEEVVRVDLAQMRDLLKTLVPYAQSGVWVPQIKAESAKGRITVYYDDRTIRPSSFPAWMQNSEKVIFIARSPERLLEGDRYPEGSLYVGSYSTLPSSIAELPFPKLLVNEQNQVELLRNFTEDVARSIVWNAGLRQQILVWSPASAEPIDLDAEHKNGYAFFSTQA